MSVQFRKYAKAVFSIEAEAISNLIHQLDRQFDDAVTTILSTKGRVVISGVGKSGIIGRKISATLASTGTPSLFLHPVEAFHGDLGMLRKEDVFIAISYSGETEELLKLIPFVQSQKIKLIALTGNPKSSLAKNANFHLNVHVDKEACPLKLAPTSSTTATLVMGDAIAVALMKARKFEPKDFAQFHPGGSLGRKLVTTVEQVMSTENLPLVNDTTPLIQVIDSITKGRLGLAVVIKNKKIEGLITDGDLRRAMEKHKEKLFSLSAKNIMTKNPKSIPSQTKLSVAEELMSKHKITSLLVIDNKQLKGIIQLYSINNG